MGQVAEAESMDDATLALKLQEQYDKGKSPDDDSASSFSKYSNNMAASDVIHFGGGGSPWDVEDEAGYLSDFADGMNLEMYDPWDTLGLQGVSEDNTVETTNTELPLGAAQTIPSTTNPAEVTTTLAEAVEKVFGEVLSELNLRLAEPRKQGGKEASGSSEGSSSSAGPSKAAHSDDSSSSGSISNDTKPTTAAPTPACEDDPADKGKGQQTTPIDLGSIEAQTLRSWYSETLSNVQCEHCNNKVDLDNLNPALLVKIWTSVDFLSSLPGACLGLQMQSSPFAGPGISNDPQQIRLKQRIMAMRGTSLDAPPAIENATGAEVSMPKFQYNTVLGSIKCESCSKIICLACGKDVPPKRNTLTWHCYGAKVASFLFTLGALDQFVKKEKDDAAARQKQVEMDRQQRAESAKKNQKRRLESMIKSDNKENSNERRVRELVAQTDRPMEAMIGLERLKRSVLILKGCEKGLGGILPGMHGYETYVKNYEKILVDTKVELNTTLMQYAVKQGLATTDGGRPKSPTAKRITRAAAAKLSKFKDLIHWKGKDDKSAEDKSKTLTKSPTTNGKSVGSPSCEYFKLHSTQSFDVPSSLPSASKGKKTASGFAAHVAAHVVGAPPPPKVRPRKSNGTGYGGGSYGYGGSAWDDGDYDSFDEPYEIQLAATEKADFIEAILASQQLEINELLALKKSSKKTKSSEVKSKKSNSFSDMFEDSKIRKCSPVHRLITAETMKAIIGQGYLHNGKFVVGPLPNGEQLPSTMATFHESNAVLHMPQMPTASSSLIVPFTLTPLQK
jgi:hypothetical protein